MIEQARAELAPNGVLRAGINMSNFLLVTGKAANGDPQGVSPDMAAEAARRLGVDVQYVTYPNPGLVADASVKGEWDGRHRRRTRARQDHQILGRVLRNSSHVSSA